MNNDILIVVKQIEQALSLLHSPTSTSKQREETQLFLEQVKNKENAHSYAIAIITSSNNDIVKHFALHIIETLVKNRWNQANDQEKETIKKEILELMARIPPNEPKFIKEKLVTIIVEVIKRDWPQRWMNLMTLLIDISKISDTQSELVLSTFGQLPHDIIFESSSTTTSNLLSDQRRKDLMAGINTAVSLLFDFFYTMLESRYTLYKQQQQQQPTAAASSSNHIHLINVLLTALRSYIDWVPAKVIFDHKLDHIFCQLLLDIPFRVGACENLILFLNRKGRMDETLELTHTPFNLMDNFYSAIKVTSSNFEDDYTFHKKLTQALTILGTVHLTSFEKDHKIPNNYSKYLQLMLELGSHPSILLSSFTLSFWVTFLKVESLELSYLEEVVKQVLETLLSKFVRVGDPEKSDSEPSKYSEIDFGTSKEWSNFFGGVRTRYFEMIKLISSQRREMTYIFIASKIAQLLETLKGNLGVSLSHEQTLILESHSSFLDVVLSSVKDQETADYHFFNKEQQKQPMITQLTDNVLKLLFEINSLEPNITSFQIDSLQAYTLYYETNPESIQFLLNKIVPLIPFPGLDNPSKAYQNSVLHTRRRAISSLIGISTNISHLMKPYFATLYQSVVELFQNNVVNETEKVMLFHLLIVFSNNLPSYQQIFDFYKSILEPIIAQWSSPEITSAVSSADSLIQYLGLSTPDSAALDPTILARRKTIQYIVCTLQIFWKKSQVPTNTSDEQFAPFISNGISYNGKWPISSFIKQVLPGVLSLIRTVHQLWEPQYKAKVHSSLITIFDLDDSITAPLLGYEYHKENKSESKNVTFLRNLMDSLRDGCYEIIGYGFTHSDELFGLPDLSKVLYEYVFSGLDFIENRHLKLLMKQVLNFLVRQCPQKLQKPIFEPILPLLFSILYNRIKAGWEVVLLRVQKQSTDHEKVEIVEDKILRDISMEFLMSATSIISQLPYVLTSVDIMTPMVYSISTCLMAMDTPIVKKSLTLTTLLINNEKSNNPLLYKLIGHDMFSCCVSILRTNKFAELSNDIQNVIRFIYMKYYQVSSCPQDYLLFLGISPSIIQAFNSDLALARTEKSQKVLFKKLLQDVIGIPLNKLKKESILDLPEKLVFKKLGPESWLDSNQENNNNNNNNNQDLSSIFK